MMYIFIVTEVIASFCFYQGMWVFAEQYFKTSQNVQHLFDNDKPSES